MLAENTKIAPNRKVFRYQYLLYMVKKELLQIPQSTSKGKTQKHLFP